MKTSVTIFLSFLLIFVLLVVAMAGCKGGSGEKADKTATPSAPAFTPQQNESADAPGGDDEAKALTSLDVAKRMGNGINLGNTMEAYGRTAWHRSSVSAYETFWGSLSPQGRPYIA